MPFHIQHQLDHIASSNRKPFFTAPKGSQKEYALLLTIKTRRNYYTQKETAPERLELFCWGPPAFNVWQVDVACVATWQNMKNKELQTDHYVSRCPFVLILTAGVLNIVGTKMCGC